ncbi:MAG: hypothetical protein LBS20_20285 [Prevotella sp.]|nr:hypothetical protein [Prevotella sp.]
MKKKSLKVYLDATAQQLAACDITEPGLLQGELYAWDFNTMAVFGPAARVHAFYNENDYYLVPMKYICFTDLTIEEANFIYPDAYEANITMVPGLSVDQHIGNIERKYLPRAEVKVIYYEVLPGRKLRAIFSLTAHRHRLIEAFIGHLRDMNLRVVCFDDYIDLRYSFNGDIQNRVSALFNTYIGFWRSLLSAHLYTKPSFLSLQSFYTNGQNIGLYPWGSYIHYTQ